jgi:hypothetical protein
LFIRPLRSEIQSLGSNRPTYLGNQEFVSLLQFLDEQTIESIFQLNGVALRRAALSHALFSASGVPATLG